MSEMSIRLVILTEIIAPYRIPVFNALARQPGLELHVIFLAETNATLRRWRVYKDEICFSYQVLPSLRMRFCAIDLLVNRGLSSALNKANPHVIICGGYNYAASWQALLWAKRRGVKFLLWSESNRHDARRGWEWVEFLKMYFLRQCDGFVVPGKASFEYLTSLGSAEGSISTAPNAVDNDLFATQANAARIDAAEVREKLKLPARFILFVGRLVPEKGVFDLLEAYAKLESGLRSGVGLVFAGDGVSRAELAQKAKRISPGTVCFPGFAQREDLAWFMRSRKFGHADA
jgi:glycosyltransferase involved in cell wall biosynthesis